MSPDAILFNLRWLNYAPLSHGLYWLYVSFAAEIAILASYWAKLILV